MTLKIPLVAIVGRPNVGKSRLFNRLTGSRRAIVDGTPGATRDRNYGEAEWYGHVFNLVDTGGFDPGSQDELLVKMREQAQIAIDQADVVLVLFDGRDGLLPQDQEIVELMRRGARKVFYAVNKIDSERMESLVAEFQELGIDQMFPISAEHGRGVDDLMDVLIKPFPTVEAIEAEREAGPRLETRIAVIGRPNVGKSTLINQLIGEERLLTSEIPGTTRDAIDIVLERDGHRHVIIDTAGARRRRAVETNLEKLSVLSMLSSIDRADVVLFLLDSVEGPTDQDARLLNLVEEKGRGLVILFNKWDLVAKDGRTADEYLKAFARTLPTIGWAPVVFISAKTGLRVSSILERAHRVKEAWERRIPTAEVNTFLIDLVNKVQLPLYRGRHTKLMYMSQLKARPPLFMVVANYPDAVPPNYKRFLLNQLREAFAFEGTPLRVVYRKRTRRPGREDVA